APAMDRELRHVVARVEPARLAPDLLAEAIGVEQLVRADRHGVESFEQAELLELPDRMRQRVDADAKLANAISLFVDLAVDPARMQHERCCESADAPADDDGLHYA